MESGESIVGLTGQKWCRVWSNPHSQTQRKLTSHPIFWNEHFLGLLCGSLWWPVFNTPSDTSFLMACLSSQPGSLWRTKHAANIYLCLESFFHLHPFEGNSQDRCRMTYTKWRNKQKYLFLCPQTTVPPEGEDKLAAAIEYSKQTPAVSMKASGVKMFFSFYMREIYAQT